jgi:metal-responsive CopG/Arc/MetJ family transcriptional regulator
MRMHIEFDDELIKKIDEVAGPRGRSKFVREAVEKAIDWEERWKLIRASRGAIADYGHEWDEDPAAWVHRERFSDPRRVG